MLSRSEVLQIANDQVKESNKVLHRALHNSSASMNYVFDRHEYDAEDDAVDKPLKAIVQITNSKSKLLYKLRRKERMKYNKFVSHIADTNTDSQCEDEHDNHDSKGNDDGNEEDDDDLNGVSSPSLYEIDFGFQFKYWSSYRQSTWFIPKKHRNLKTEITQNKRCYLSFKQVVYH